MCWQCWWPWRHFQEDTAADGVSPRAGVLVPAARLSQDIQPQEYRMTEGTDSSTDLGRYLVRLGDPVLREVAEKACGRSVACVQGEVQPFDWPIYGCGGEKAKLKLSYQNADGGSGEKEVYVKRQEGDPGYKETPHYRYLNSMQMPVPRFYSSHLDGDGMEVLFLEHVRPNRDGKRILKSPENCHAFLSIAARVNALSPRGQYGEDLFYFGQERSIDRGKCTVRALWESAASGRLGNGLRNLCTAGNKNGLLAMAESLRKILPAMARGYAINDLAPVVIGWRHDTGEMLVCELRTTGLGPRFVDAAPWIGCPEHAQKAGYRRKELADHYFTEYLAAGGREVPFGELLAETHALWQAGILAGLNWWYDHALTGIESFRDEDKGRGMCRKRLERDLADLLESLRGGGKG